MVKLAEVKPLIYVASPYTDKEYAVRHLRYEEVTAFVNWLLVHDHNAIPFAPIMYTHELAKRYDLPFKASDWEAFNDAFQTHCVGLYVLAIDGWSESVGVKREIEYARARFQPILLWYPSINGYTSAPLVG